MRRDAVQLPLVQKIRKVCKHGNDRDRLDDELRALSILHVKQRVAIIQRVAIMQNVSFFLHGRREWAMRLRLHIVKAVTQLLMC